MTVLSTSLSIYRQGEKRKLILMVPQNNGENRFKRKNAPKNKNDTTIPEDEVDWSYVISNNRLLKITKETGITLFCDIQHLKYMTHVTRLKSSSSLKQCFLCKPSIPCTRWKILSKLMNIDEIQLRVTMRDRMELQQRLTHIYK